MYTNLAPYKIASHSTYLLKAVILNVKSLHFDISLSDFGIPLFFTYL